MKSSECTVKQSGKKFKKIYNESYLYTYFHFPHFLILFTGHDRHCNDIMQRSVMCAMQFNCAMWANESEFSFFFLYQVLIDFFFHLAINLFCAYYCASLSFFFSVSKFVIDFMLHPNMNLFWFLFLKKLVLSELSCCIRHTICTHRHIQTYTILHTFVLYRENLLTYDCCREA